MTGLSRFSFEIYFLGLCIAFSSWLLSDALRPIKVEKIPVLMNENELASYLGISNEEVKTVIPYVNNDGSIEGNMPFVIIDDKFYYSKTAIDAWLLKSIGR